MCNLLYVLHTILYLEPINQVLGFSYKNLEKYCLVTRRSANCKI